MREGCVMRSEDMCCKGRVNGVNLNGYGKKEGVLISEGRCFFILHIGRVCGVKEGVFYLV